MLVQSSPGGGGSGVKEIIRILNERDLPALWILEYKLMGKEGYAYNDITVRAEMFQSSSAINDLQINGESLEFVLTETSIEDLMTFSEWLKTVFDLVEYHELFENIETIEQVVNDAQIMACIETSPTARAAIAGSKAAMTAIASSQVAKDIVIGSANFMDAVAKSEVAMEVVVSNASFINQISTSQVAMEAIAGSKIAMYAVANSEIAMNAVNDSDVAVQAINASPTAMWEIGHSVIAKSVSNYESTSDNIAGLSSESHAAYTAGIIDKEYIGNWTIQAANGTYMALIAADIVAMNAVINNAPAMSAVAGSATAVGAIVANAVAMNAVIISSVAMHALADSYTSMNIIAINQAAIVAIVGSPIAMQAMANHEISMELIINTHNFLTAVDNNVTIAVNAVINDRVSMWSLGKYHSLSTATTNFATTHNNLISRNDSLISAYLAGWLGASSVNDYKSMAELLANNSYLTALGNNAALMALLNANNACCTAIGKNLNTAITNINSKFLNECGKQANIMTAINNDSIGCNDIANGMNGLLNGNNNTFLNACGSKSTIMSTIDNNSLACTAIVNNISKTIDATTFWAGCCAQVKIMTAIAASSTAMNIIAASNTAMTTVANYQNALDKIWSSTIATNSVCAGTSFNSLVSLQSTLQSFGYAASNAGSDHTIWNDKKTFIANGKTIICNYSGAVKNITLCPGTYKLEVWGAQGGVGWKNGSSSSNSTYSIPGKGGYSYGNKAITVATTYYLYVGGEGNSAVDYASYGGWNGGGGLTNNISSNSGYKCGATGGGATDISTSGGNCTQDTTHYRWIRTSASYAGRIIVAGGGGACERWTSYCIGGSGGGTTGGSGGQASSSTATSPSSVYATGGTQSAVGSSSNYNSGWVTKYDGGVGLGTSCTGGHQNHATALPGGGGWYGGGCGQYGGGGGSGYIGGVTGGSMTNGSRSGNGYAQITRISA